MTTVPKDFRPHHPFNYPPDNDMIFEEWFYHSMIAGGQHQPIGTREYLPIFWTSYYVKHNHGKHTQARKNLQAFLDRLDNNKRYFTIVQFDDGILNDISRHDIKVYAMCGDRRDYELPLLCKPHKYQYRTQAKKKYEVNFVGKRTHPVRDEIFKMKRNGWYLSDRTHAMNDYCAAIAGSMFTLCPRGYGATSFRIAEAMQYGSIPVYITDDFINPHSSDISLDDYCVLLKMEDIQHLEEAIRDADIAKLQQNIPYIYHNYFSYEANKQLIFKDLCDERDREQQSERNISYRLAAV